MSPGAEEAWHETQAIQDALAEHGCNLQTAVAYLCRENVPNAQMIITKMLRSLQGLSPGNLPGPLFNRRQAEEWIQYQNEVIRRVTLSIQYLSDPRGTQLTQRPFAGVTPYKRDPDTQNVEGKGEKEEIETAMEHEVGSMYPDGIRVFADE
ncbi:hypothetical protein FB451DRAFT_1494880 [Mycena latifolia]|nr:hypothetical protein FB451DRAFT_1494880 [Mycena latifolia]